MAARTEHREASATNPHARADEVSRRLHALIADRLVTRPALVDAARDAVVRWRDAGTLDDRYASRWLTLLAGPVAGVLAVLRSDDEASRELRQNSPFVGAVTPRERWDIIRAVDALLQADAEGGNA